LRPEYIGIAEDISAIYQSDHILIRDIVLACHRTILLIMLFGGGAFHSVFVYSCKYSVRSERATDNCWMAELSQRFQKPWSAVSSACSSQCDL